MNSKSHNQNNENNDLSSNVFTADLFRSTATHFNLKRKRTASTYIPQSAERTKRFYPELQADQAFLHQMLDIWNLKLEQLQGDEKLLMKMLNTPESALQGVKPLLGRFNLNEPVFESSSKETSSQRQRGPINDIDDQEEEEEEEEEDDHYTLAPEGESPFMSAEEIESDKEDEQALQQQHWASELTSDEEDDDREGPVDEEDEEATRRALTFMLAEFGDELE